MVISLRRAVIRGTSVLLRGLFILFGGYRVRGLEKVPKTGAAILAGNHLSWADPPAVRIAIRRKCWFMANEFLFHIPVLGMLIPIYGAFPVHRDRLDRDAIRRAEAYLDAGDLLCVFPEGGTSESGRLVPFEGGVALLALRKNVPIIPMALTGTDKVLPPSAPYPHFTRGGVTLTFGDPIYPHEVDESLPRKERVEALTQRLYNAVAALLPADYLPETTVPTTAAPNSDS